MTSISTLKKLVLLGNISLLLLNCAGKRTGKISLDPNSQKLLDYIGYIILPIEEKIFREMPPDDRGEFLKDFWARRDPDPSTPLNEFQEAYYSRLAMATDSFRAGVPGWKTDRGRIFILLGPPRNILRKPMGDVPDRDYFKANIIEEGAVSEKATEIWVYDNLPDFFQGPLSLVFVDYQGTGQYKLTTNVKINPYSMASSIRDEIDLTKYQLVGKTEKEDVQSLEAINILDYDVAVNPTGVGEGASVALSIDIPYFRLGFRREENGYSCDLNIQAEVRSDQKMPAAKKEEPVSQTFSEDELKEIIKNKNRIHKDWTMNINSGGRLIYVSITDNVKGKRLRKLLEIKPK